MPNPSTLLRLALILPLMFVAIFLALGLVFAVVAAIWPFLLGGSIVLGGVVLIGLHVS